MHDISASPISFWTTTEPETWGKVPYFLVFIAVFSPCFCQTNRPEPARKVVQDDKVTHTNLYEGPSMIFLPLLYHFGLLQSFRDGEGTSFFSVHSRVFPLFFVKQIDLNRLEKLFRMI